MKLSQLLSGIIDIGDDQDFHQLEIDSRRVKSGDIFLAEEKSLPHIKQAVENGAAAIICDSLFRDHVPEALCIAVPSLDQHRAYIIDRAYGSPSKQLSILGVTGTNGKTTCAHLSAQAINKLGGKCALMGTVGNGFLDAIESSTHTTSDLVTVQRCLATYVSQQASHVAMEVSSHALDQGRVAGVSFFTAIFTNLTREHLDYHGTMEAYAKAKQQLFQMPGIKQAIINVDDEYGPDMFAACHSNTSVIAVSLKHKQFDERQTVYADSIVYSRQGISAEVSTPWGVGLLQLELLGKFNLVNALCVLAALCAEGFTFSEVLDAMQGLQPVAGRMQAIRKPGMPTVIVDYAHTPDALEKALKMTRKHVTGRLLCVFGCGGDRDTGKRPVMGRIAEQFADEVVITDDNPRNESPVQIIDQICAGMQQPEKASIIHEREDAIRQAFTQASDSDVIVVAGKGHETTQIIGDERRHFSDVETVHRLLAEKR